MPFDFGSALTALQTGSRLKPLFSKDRLGTNPSIEDFASILQPTMVGQSIVQPGSLEERAGMQSEIGMPESTSAEVEPDTLSRLRTLLESGPEYNEPGKWRKLAATGAAILMKDPNMFNLVDIPRQRATEEWKQKIGALGTLSKAEAEAAQTELNRRTATRLENRDAEIAANNASRRAIEWERLSRQLPDAERMELQHKYNVALEEYRQGGRRTLAEINNEFDRELENLRHQHGLQDLGVRHEQTMTEIGERGQESRLTRQTPTAASASSRAETATNMRTRRQEAARQFQNQNPELAHFIKFDADGNVQITPPGERGRFDFGKPNQPTKAEWDKINQAIYGNEDVRSATGRSSTTPVAIPAGKVKVEKNGQQFFLPANQLQEAIRQGYKQVQ